MDVNQMEGWLLKKKSKSGMFNNDVRRWFKIQRLEGTEDELALCYFSSNKSKDVKGWIFLSDITELSEEKSSLTVVSPARTLTVGTQTIGEHRLWITALVKLCPNALYTGETASKVRNGDYAEEKSSHDFDSEYDSKAEDARDRDRRSRRSSSRDSMDHNRDLRDDREPSMGSRGGGGKESLSLRTSNSREDFTSAESDDERRHRDRGGHERSHRKYRSGDDNSTGSSGSRGRGSRMPNTSDDHRKGGNLSYPDASTAARMHSHISGEPDDRMHRGRPPPQQPSRGARSRSRENDEHHRGEDTHRDSYELEAYDMSKASALLSREERMRLSKEDQMRDQGDNMGRSNEEKDSGEEHVPAIVKRKKPAPPPGGPQPPWRSPNREDSSDEEKSPDRDHRDSDGVDSDNTPIQKPVKKRGVSIEDMIDEPILSVNLDDSDEEEKVDFKAEKRRYAGDAKAQSEREKIENAKSKPPLAPPKATAARQGADQSPRSHKGGDSSRMGSAGAGVDSNFVSDDWDDDIDSPPKAMGKPSVHTGSQADSNWLDEDFDD
mmetsp:Transcript_29020/g.53936  ORF Transcript_29020/g.53936 Transcript_29020/m.53936 type:complete len:549 (+) Transcript_29020:155-1801(+)|eukprot:CAMPEP_0114435210 /NCGR_PEP_ID=MMETSP0103-20121206/12699_1 /TAXON_ID=37642 ORGANISM="Paraphysomonas imperforata, Strain PA2" /NCGR_SAMPLE_ID=MMETSP0103 /ASSEMBLY_ACC=CAM_ASM_000201 /LENGTH=548 /DNA_ID=CAMNT_0001605201 /DNA_START=85 /DNA_END=1731 /DNA_ORIENTATION=+